MDKNWQRVLWKSVWKELDDLRRFYENLKPAGGTYTIKKVLGYNPVEPKRG